MNPINDRLCNRSSQLAIESSLNNVATHLIISLKSATHYRWFDVNSKYSIVSLEKGSQMYDEVKKMEKMEYQYLKIYALP